MRDCIVTSHARERATERFGVAPSAAWCFVQEAWRRSIRVPWRYACQLSGTTDHKRKGHAVVRVAGTRLLVCRGHRVVTIWKLDVEELATVLTWAATGCWVGRQ